MSLGRSSVLGLATVPAAATSYEERYGLTERPFGLSPDVRFAYSTEPYGKVLHEALQALRRREGLVIITGETGTGKTLLTRLILQQLDEHTCVSVVLDPYVTFEELLLQALGDFGALPDGALTPAAASRHQLLALLQRFLASLISRNAYAVIVIDEAHDLAPGVLEQVRLLSNFETDEAKLLQVVLVGQPGLARQIERPEMRRLQQRVARHCELPPMSPYDTARYIERRLSTSWKLAAIRQGETALPAESGSGFGAARVRFTPAAIRAVSAFSGGNPRAINLLCDRALELGHEQAALTIDRRLVRRARQRLEQRPARRTSPARLAALATAAVLIVGVPGGWFLAARSPLAQAAAEALPVAASAAAEIDARGTADAVATTAAESMAEPGDSFPAFEPAGSPTGSLPVGSSVTVGVASLRDRSGVDAVMSRIDRVGLPVYSRLQGGWHQVVVGPYLARSEAEDARRILAANGFGQTRLFVADGAAGGGAVNASAIDFESAGVVLLAAGGRTSVVLEVTAEPRQVLVRRVGDTVLEVDAGPVTAPLPARRMNAPAGVALLAGLSLETIEASGREQFVRARLSVSPMTRGNVRVVGRRVYIDLAPPWPDGGPLPGSAPESDALVVVKPEAAAASLSDAYRLSIEAALDRFEELQPFVLSAIDSSRPDVLAAVARTVNSLATSVRANAVPVEARSDHELFASAVAQVERAVAPVFAGDRRTEAARAIAQVAEARRRLKGAS